MITSNFKKFLMLTLQSNGLAASPAIIPGRLPNGNIVYIAPTFGRFPEYPDRSLTLSMNAAGIHIGSGSTPPTEDDYTIETPITSGISSTSPIITTGYDGDGNPYINHLFTLTNTTASDIVIREIGYYVTLAQSATQGASTSLGGAFMIDRTLLETPLTVAANDVAVLKYQLKTIIP